MEAFTLLAHLVQPVKHRISGRHGAKPTTGPPVRTKIRVQEVALHVEDLCESSDVLWGQLRLLRASDTLQG